MIQPYLKPWLIPDNRLGIKYFYEGLPSWESRIPWHIWIKPLLAWAVLVIALCLIMICMMVAIRRQWIEHERLTYPLAQLPLEMTAKADKFILNRFFRSKMMWLGFGLVFGLSSLKGLHFYNPAVPMFETVQSILIFKRKPNLVFRLSFPMLGFFYMVNLDVAFSMWFFSLFSLFSLLVRGFLTVFNIHVTENLGIYGSPSPIFAHLGMGAIGVLVALSIWTGRTHLGEVCQKAIYGSPEIDDGNEILSYRAAIFGISIGLIIMGGWLTLSGIPVAMTIIFLTATFVIFIGLTRIVAEAGMAEAVASTIGSSFTISSFGARSLGVEGLTAMAQTYVWSADIRTFVMASAANGLKIMDKTCRHSRPLFWAMMLAVITTMISSIWMLLNLSYRHGGINGNSWFFSGGAKAPYNYIISLLINPPDTNWLGWIFKSVGSLVMLFLMFMRSRFLWFPFHPIGFAIGPIWIMDQIWVTVFFAWMIKLIFLKYSGMKLYRNARPFFLGLILGQFTCNGFWIVLDLLTNHRGNQIFWI